jgi:lipopolysaccharide export system protein LptA
VPLNTKLLRRSFFAAAVLLILAVAGFYWYARYRFNQQVHDIPKKLGVNIQQSANGFTFSKSEGDRTLFSISAGKAVQFKGTQHASLSDVRIIIYARNGTYDQIYGSEFDYDAQAGVVNARGEVMIDLAAKGKPAENASGSTAGAIHAKTSGLSFNQKTGIAETSQKVEFSFPQAQGSAVGAHYDSHSMVLALDSDVNISASAAGKQPALRGTEMHAQSARIDERAREAVLQKVTAKQPARQQTMSAETLTLHVRDDNTIERVVAQGGVTSRAPASELTAQSAQFEFAQHNALSAALFTGNVQFSGSGQQNVNGSAGRVQATFGPKNQLTGVRASQNVKFTQAAQKPAAQKVQLQAEQVDFVVGPGNRLQRATTSGEAQIVIAQPASGKTPAQTTTVSADIFDALFAGKNRLTSLHGAPNAKTVTTSAGSPDRVTTSRELLVQFDAGHPGAISSITQHGQFHYTEGTRSASAESAKLTPANDMVALTGNSRARDSSTGISATADSVRLNSKTGELVAQGSVKTTYEETKPTASGAMLSSGEPVHVTAANLTADKASQVATFTGAARLWEAGNIVEANSMVFNRAKRELTATSTGAGGVRTVFVQSDTHGKQVPVNVTASKLIYSDASRRARFEGGVLVKSQEMALHADHIDILLKGRSAPANLPQKQGSSASSQLDTITAEGHLVIEEPGTKATGTKLVYTADDGKFVLTGEPNAPPSIFDTERGNITGDSLTFFSRSDTVQVTSSQSTRTITRTRLKDEKKP